MKRLAIVPLLLLLAATAATAQQKGLRVPGGDPAPHAFRLTDLEIEPPAHRKLPQPAESFHQSWSARSEPIPAQSDVPQNPPAVIVAPPNFGAPGLPQRPHRPSGRRPRN